MNERKQRFLEFYQQLASIARAARHAGVHRATAYRWMSEDGFATTMRQAKEAVLQRRQAKAMAEDAERKRLRAEGARERWRTRRENLTQARAARIRDLSQGLNASERGALTAVADVLLRALKAGDPQVAVAVAEFIVTALGASKSSVEARG